MCALATVLIASSANADLNRQLEHQTPCCSSASIRSRLATAARCRAVGMTQGVAMFDADLRLIICNKLYAECTA